MKAKLITGERTIVTTKTTDKSLKKRIKKVSAKKPTAQAIKLNKK